MEAEQRQRLQRGRVRLVRGLQLEALWGPLVRDGVFSRDMLDDIQRAGSPRDQARQLLIDLETRGKQAFPTFVSILRETGQKDLADFLSDGCAFPRPSSIDIKPIEIGPRGGRGRAGGRDSEYLPLPVQARTERDQELDHPGTVAHSAAADRFRQNSDMVYVLKSRPCGYCLIINNVHFSPESGLSLRQGSDLDYEKLKRRFSLFHFEVLTRQDLKAKEMYSELWALAKKDHSAMDCCLVVILSHGRQRSHIQFPGEVCGTDGNAIPVEKIVNCFNGLNCWSLRGKPKLFIIQACGGEEKDYGFELDSDSSGNQGYGASLESDASPLKPSSGNLDEPDAVASVPKASDILVSYSTFPGFVSWRDRKSGSWFVETLDRILEQYADSEDLQKLLLRVANEVSTKEKYKQMPGCYHFLRKWFFFMTK
ncbi:caspase-9 [Alligator mississippiensis]|uniref:Caspase-9 n=1 Tax=Alligator mississippiensis TaxID=8496 RepID=A0A151MJ40_ALLMI|nr:caspase-9 [Alligator mississippiensis]